ncbi:MAG: AsnC family transcriptional regulator [Solirubrobacterales bacterium]|nr:AsnC family transcriptional regulator [Solirubrobacterales bacterium]
MATDLLDDSDREIVSLLLVNARATVADIARQVPLSATAIKRRIARLEELGVITGYTVQIDFAKLGWGIEAFAEIRFTGTTHPDDMPEVLAVFTTAGDHDALVWIRTRDVAHLTSVIAALRSHSQVIGTRTQMILASYVKSDWQPHFPHD